MNKISCEVTLVSYKNNIKETIKIVVPPSMNMEDLNFLVKRDFPHSNIVAVDRLVSSQQPDVKDKYCFAILTDGRKAIAEVKGGLIHLFGGGAEKGESANQCMFRELREELRRFGLPYLALNLTGAFDARTTVYHGSQYLEMFYLIEVDFIDEFSHNEGGTLVTFEFSLDEIKKLRCDDMTMYGLLKAFEYYN